MSQLLPDGQWGTTEINVHKSSYTWKIRNFSYAQDGVVYKSPQFTVNPGDGIKWYLDLYINGPADSDLEGNVSLFVNAGISASSCAFDVEYSVAVIDNSGEKCFAKSKKRRLTKTTNYGKIGAFVNRSDLLGDEQLFLDNDTLTLRCDFVVIGDCNSSSFDAAKPDQSWCGLDELLAEERLKTLDAFETCLLSSEAEDESSDVTLRASCGRSLRAHKFVLSSRSPVFRAMFRQKMLEASSSQVEVADMDYQVLRELLRFMYAARVEGLDDDGLVAGLLDAAEKYQVQGLKDVCVEHLRRGLRIDNVIDMLQLCNRYELRELKARVTKLVALYAKDVIATDGFKAIKDTQLLAEIVAIIAIK
ncbi:hypothetical protein TKK_0016230 [Trichogramma kaykai]|uniref:BTB domain-containing protein n=1 Tax=Trichogramma kaykai TaxID=54128 RepID=A0ABD2W817_9HYME